MPLPRFATAQALFDAFPEVSQKVTAAPTDQSPIVFLKALLSANKLPDAVTCCAYLLPRRESVWWACGCVRALSGDIAPDRAAGLLAAEAWVYEPDDERRQAALDVATKGQVTNPMTWLAFAAGWSGGILASSTTKQIPRATIHDRESRPHCGPDKRSKPSQGQSPSPSARMRPGRHKTCGSRSMICRIILNRGITNGGGE